MTHALQQMHNVQWRVLLDENEWERDERVEIPAGEEAALPPGKKRRTGWFTAGLLLALAMALSVRLWQQAQTGLAAVERGISHTLALESQAQTISDNLLTTALLDPQSDPGWRFLVEREAKQAEASGPSQVELLDFSLRGEYALARVRVRETGSGAIYRKSRYYRETEGGWRRSQPVAALWGSPQTLESEHFVFHFRQWDGVAVAEAAALLDPAYAQLHGALGIPLSARLTAQEKVQVRVAAWGEVVGDIWYESGDMLWVVSPLLLRLPERISEGQALAEQIAFTLRRMLVNRAIAPLWEGYQPAPVFLNGLRLWLAWDEEMALNSYRRELVGWLYPNGTDLPEQLPLAYLEVCEIFGAWQLTSRSFPILFQCVTPSPALPLYFGPPTSLRHLSLSIYQNGLYLDEYGYPLADEFRAGQQSQPIAIATVLEYAAHTYGAASVAELLQAGKEGESWSTATGQLFGVPADEFEAGWQTWLVEEYGVDPAQFDFLSP